MKVLPLFEDERPPKVFTKIRDGKRFVIEQVTNKILTVHRIFPSSRIYTSTSRKEIGDLDYGAYEFQHLGKLILSSVSPLPERVRWGNSFWIQKEKPTTEKVLVILPCNNGVVQGNYFRGGSPYTLFWNSWRSLDLTCRSTRDNLYLAALDCTITKDVEGKQDGRGALVFENEMERVHLTKDYGPPDLEHFCFNPKKQSNKRLLLDRLVEDIKIGLSRTDRFETIVALLSPSAYRMAFYAAVEEMGLWNKVLAFDYTSPASSAINSKLFQVLYQLGLKERGIICPVYIKFFSQSNKRASKIPDRFQYQKYSVFKDDWYFPNLRRYITTSALSADYNTTFITKEDSLKDWKHIMKMYNISPVNGVASKQELGKEATKTLDYNRHNLTYIKR